MLPNWLACLNSTSPVKAPVLRHSSIFSLSLSADDIFAMTFACTFCPGSKLLPRKIALARESVRNPSTCFLSEKTMIFVMPWSFSTYCSNVEYEISLLTELLSNQKMPPRKSSTIAYIHHRLKRNGLFLFCCGDWPLLEGVNAIM